MPRVKIVRVLEYEGEERAIEAILNDSRALGPPQLLRSGVTVHGTTIRSEDRAFVIADLALRERNEE